MVIEGRGLELTWIYTVLVRRVVEARRAAAGGGGGGGPSIMQSRTAALPPVNEKANSSPTTPLGEGNAQPKESFWKKLRCW